MDLKTKLSEKISGAVKDDKKTLDTYSRDWSLFEVKPSAVVFPRSAADIQEVVSFVKKNKKKYPELSITARAAGTDMSGGPLNTGIILDTTKYLKGVHDVIRGESTTQSSFYGHEYRVTGEAVVLPGTFYRDFEKQTLRHNLILPCYPASRELCAVGGMVANNGAGEKTLKYGQNKDFVKQLKVVLSDGKEYIFEPMNFESLSKKMKQRNFEGRLHKGIYQLIKKNWDLIQEHKPKTSKNASGYYLWDVVDAVSIVDFEAGKGMFDMTKLVVGAQGTTGIVTEITYKLVDNEPAHDLLVVYVDDLTVVPNLVKKLMKTNLEMLEMYDDNTFKIGVKFFKDFLKDKGFFGAIKYGLRFMPEVWMAIRGGVPKLIVLAEFSGQSEREVHEQMKKAVDSIKDLGLRTHMIPRDSEEEKFWDFRHDSFKLLTEHSSETRIKGEGTRTAPFIDDIAVNPEHLPKYLPRLIKILEEYNLMYTVAGHLGNGNFHIIPLMGLKDAANSEKIIEISKKVYDLALEYDGTLSAEHNDGIVRTPFLERQFGPDMIKLFQKTKDLFDPLNMFNPGKKVGGTFESLKECMPE